MDTNVSVTVSFFIPIFTPKQGDFPNFATHLLQVLSSCCGFEVCPGCLIPTYCAFNSLNDRYSLYDRQSKSMPVRQIPNCCPWQNRALWKSSLWSFAIPKICFTDFFHFAAPPTSEQPDFVWGTNLIFSAWRAKIRLFCVLLKELVLPLNNPFQQTTVTKGLTH